MFVLDRAGLACLVSIGSRPLPREKAQRSLYAFTFKKLCHSHTLWMLHIQTLKIFVVCENNIHIRHKDSSAISVYPAILSGSSGERERTAPRYSNTISITAIMRRQENAEFVFSDSLSSLSSVFPPLPDCIWGRPVPLPPSLIRTSDNRYPSFSPSASILGALLAHILSVFQLVLEIQDQLHILLLIIIQQLITELI